MSFPKAFGVSRVADNDKVVLVSFNRPLTDDELRVLHEEIRLLEHEVIAFEIVGRRH